jgi:hypothetical protein
MERGTVRASEREAARVASSAIGGRPGAARYADDDESHRISIASFVDAPTSGYTTYSTIGLHLYANVLDGTNVPIELAATVPSAATYMANVLATSAFYVMKDGWLAAPGVVFPGVLAEYRPTPPEHILWVPPFPWEQLAEVPLPSGIAVHWLLGVPVFEAERQQLHDRGYDAFEAVLESADVAWFDPSRAPIL